MRALILEPDATWQAWLEERRRRGQNRRDEVWDGVLHVVPSPTVWHQRFASKLARVLGPIVEAAGYEIVHELDILDRTKGEQNYRQPDIAIFSLAADTMASGRGLDGHAELVVEVRSPGDESYEKLPFYAQCAIPEVWVADPITKAVEIYVLRDGAYVLQPQSADGTTRAPRFDLKLSIVDGPKVRIEWTDGSSEI